MGKKTLQEPTLWHLYLIECRSGAYYAGITNNLEARYQAHASGNGARYTRANPPVRLLGTVAFPDRSSASRAEWAIKQLPRREKLAFLTEVGGIAFPSAGCPSSLADEPAVRSSKARSI